VSTSPRARSVRPTRGGPTSSTSGEGGFLSLEYVMVLPVLAVLLGIVLATGAVVRDVLVLQEAARVGARVASTTTGDLATRSAVHQAAPELADGALTVRITPGIRQGGDQVQVEVTAQRRYGPFDRQLRARSTARVEPIVDHGTTQPASPARPVAPPAPAGAPAAGGAP
jgi:Flp pilus assembly protein TadG